MFPRIATIRREDKTYKYLQIVEAYRHSGRTTQRVVGDLGRLDQLDGKLDALLASLSKYAQRPFVRDDQIDCRQALPWGPVLLARHLWDQMEPGRIVGKTTSAASRADEDRCSTASHRATHRAAGETLLPE